MENTLSSRQIRERDFYNKYASAHDQKSKSVDFSPVVEPQNGGETRPWNSYWQMYGLAAKNFSECATLLDFGTGPGENALRFSRIGYNISGFDISEKNIEIASKLFSRYKNEGNFIVSSAESLPYKDNTYDIVAGIDILHHVDIEKSLMECKRVLKVGGKAFFREPVEVPILDRIRNSSVISFLVPNKASLENHITEDERKLNLVDDKLIKKIFPKTKKHYFFLFARFDKFYRNPGDAHASILEKLDYKLLKIFPILKRFAGAVIYELEK